MFISVFDLYSIGLGPSSSHTVGPMRAALQFIQSASGKLKQSARVKIDLYGSLALTGVGHGTDKAIILGLEGDRPESVDIEKIESRLGHIRQSKTINLLGKQEIPFHEQEDLLFHKTETLPYHPNGMRFTLYNADGATLHMAELYSIGGGFIVEENQAKQNHIVEDTPKVPFPFLKGDTMLKYCRENNCNVIDLMWKNELTWRTKDEIRAQAKKIWQTMSLCIDRGCVTPGILPGGLGVKRRAPEILKKLKASKGDPAELLDWVSLWALAVNEENAAGSRVVTAPTNGAAGIIPAVGKYITTYLPNIGDEEMLTYLVVSGAIGILYKIGASISAAEMGCQGEVGVACSMAAAGLAAVMGGTPEQIENAAEIGMEHNLGLTCDPVMGLVQIPCIERNTMGSIKAINAARLAIYGDGTHRVSLDSVIATMKETGNNMRSIYKETSLGGLAVNVIEC